VDALTVPGEPADGAHAWHLLVTQVEPHHPLSRDELMERLAHCGVNCSVHFIPLHHLAVFRRLGTGPAALHGADALFPKLLSLPLYPALEDDDVDRVCELIDAFARRRGRPQLSEASRRGRC
jgi:perosamine synthetase